MDKNNTKTPVGGVVLADTPIEYNKGRATVRITVHNTGDPASFCVVNMPWENHDFGTKTYMPNLLIDNLKLENNAKVNIINLKNAAEAGLEYLPSGEANKNRVSPSKYITVINNHSRYTFFLDKSNIYKDVKISDTVSFI